MKFLAFNVLVIAALFFLYRSPAVVGTLAEQGVESLDEAAEAGTAVGEAQWRGLEGRMAELTGGLSALRRRVAELEQREPAPVEPEARAADAGAPAAPPMPAASSARSQKQPTPQAEPPRPEQVAAREAPASAASGQQAVVVEGELMSPYERRGALLDLAQDMEHRFLSGGPQ